MRVITFAVLDLKSRSAARFEKEDRCLFNENRFVKTSALQTRTRKESR